MMKSGTRIVKMSLSRNPTASRDLEVKQGCMKCYEGWFHEKLKCQERSSLDHTVQACSSTVIS